MKNFNFVLLVSASAVVSLFSAGCGFGGFKNLQGVQGSGTPKTESRNVSDFKKIDAGGAVNLEISAQKEFSVAVQADDNLLEHIKTETNGDTLKIFSEGNLSPKTKINVKISMPELDSLHVSGASNAVASGVKGDSLKLDASGASKIKIEGSANSLNSDASGASEIDAENLRVENADVDASGASSTIVAATNQLKADASGASSIYYTGEPQSVVPKTSGAGSVKKK